MSLRRTPPVVTQDSANATPDCEVDVCSGSPQCGEKRTRVPLTERILDRLPGSRVRWMAAWALVPWLNLAVVLIAEDAGWAARTDLPPGGRQPARGLFRGRAVAVGRGPNQQRPPAAATGAGRGGPAGQAGRGTPHRRRRQRDRTAVTHLCDRGCPASGRDSGWRARGRDHPDR